MFDSLAAINYNRQRRAEIDSRTRLRHIRTPRSRAALRQIPVDRGARVPDSPKQLSGEIPSVSVCSVTVRRSSAASVERLPRRRLLVPGDDRRRREVAKRYSCTSKFFPADMPRASPRRFAHFTYRIYEACTAVSIVNSQSYCNLHFVL